MNRILFFINLLTATIIILPMLTFVDRPLLLSLDIIEDSERLAYDLRVRDSVGALAESKREDIAIVNIDQAALDRHGSWPWRRDKMATLVKNITNLYKARLVVLPESFLTREDQSTGIINDLRDRFYYDNAILTALDQLELDFNFDRRLLNELDTRPVIIGFEFDQTERRIGDLPVTSDFGNLDGEGGISVSELRRITNTWENYNGYISSDTEFMDTVKDVGFTNITIDPDGSVRKLKLGAQYAGSRYFSVVLAALEHFEDPEKPSALAGRKSAGIAVTGGNALTEIGARFVSQENQSQLITKSAGIDRNGDMLLSFISFGGEGRSAFDYYSAKEVMDGNQLAVQLRDKVVFIGSDSEEINDYWRTPVNARLPGVEIYATALVNLLEGTLVRPHGAWLSEGITLVLLGLILSWLFSRLKVLLGFLLTAGGLYAVYFFNYTVFWQGAGEVYRVVPFMALFATMFIVNLLARFLVEFRQKKKVEGVLNQYIPPELAREVNTSKKGFSMEGEIREMSILFSDVRGFTSISERFSAHELTKFMNRMLNTLSRQIHTNRGTIDKYIGDAVMAFWNAPLDDPRHATNSVRGAIAMQAAMTELSKELVSKGYPELKMGVGINTGEACVGNMGSEIRLSYTVMGDTVNLASRLEGITKQYGISIIVGERTYELTADDFIYRPVDSVRVKGKLQAVTIYEPIADSRYATSDHMHLQEQSLAYYQAYQERRFADVINIINDALLKHPDDGLMPIYLERAHNLLENPPAEDWEPVTNFETK